jgi:putative hydrolase of the HAD superfamily
VPELRAVVSDFGGVLTSSLAGAFLAVQDGLEIPLEAYGEAMAAAAAESGGEPPLFALERGELSEREFLGRFERGLATVLGRDVSLHGFGERLIGALHPNDELFAYYRGLRERGLRLALLTNNVREWEPLWRPKLAIDEVFETVVDSGFVGMRKPEPEIYALTLERLELPAEACVFVDDLEVNVEAARALGMQGVVYRDTAQAVGELDDLLGLAPSSPEATRPDGQFSEPRRSQQ